MLSFRSFPIVMRKTRNVQFLNPIISSQCLNNNNNNKNNGDQKVVLLEKRRLSLLSKIDPSGSNSNGNHNQGKKASSRQRKDRGQSTYKFVDRARIRVTAGDGGKGCISYVSKGGRKKRADGGNGGIGGSIILVADANEQTLGMSLHHHKAQDGAHGSSQQKHGKNGMNKIIRVPCGVVVKRILNYDEEWDEENRTVRKINFENNDLDDNNDSRDDEVMDYHFQDEQYDDNILDDTKNYDSFDFEEYDKDDLDDDDQDIYHDDIREYNDSNILYEGKGSNIFPRLQRQHQHKVEHNQDILNVVNTETKAEDGMYYWKNPDEDNSAFLGMEIHDDKDDDWMVDNMDGEEDRQEVVLADLDKPGSYVIVCNGGRGGIGNAVYAKYQYVKDVVGKAIQSSIPQKGDIAHLKLELKLIADVGLVGYPNAGKSSLLAAMSMAKPKIAPYPFTTLHPLVGSIQYKDGFRVLAADVPGLIDGASTGRGRGYDFLRHLERTKALLYIVDAASSVTSDSLTSDGIKKQQRRTPLKDIRTIFNEIASYGDGDMISRPALVVANKLDLIPNEEERRLILHEIATAAEEAGINFDGTVFGISAGVTGEGLGQLSKALRKVVIDADNARNTYE